MEKSRQSLKKVREDDFFQKLGRKKEKIRGAMGN